MISHFTDSEGRWTAHIPQGEWIVTIDAFETSPGVQEILRDLVIVSSETASHNLQMSSTESARLSFEITDEYDGNEISGLRINLISQEGLGEIRLEETDPWGKVEVQIAPGNWNFEVNSTKDSGYRWAVNSTEIQSGGVSAGDEINIEHSIPRLVRLSGTTFWDYNDDNLSSYVEGISNVSLNIELTGTNQSISHSAISDSDGHWAVFVEAGGIWNISTNASGFINQSVGSDIVQNPYSIDIELNADLVLLQGSVSYIDQNQLSQLSESIVLELISTEDYSWESVTPNMHYSNGSWNGNWSAYVQPGNWIIRGMVEEAGLLDMKLIDANVVEGGRGDIELTVGGVLRLETEWLDYWGNPHSLAEIDIEASDINGTPSVVLNIGAGISWTSLVSDNGGMEILMPVGMIDFSSEFEVSQFNRSMFYQGEQGIQIRAGQDSPLTTLSFYRITNHEIVLTTTNSTAGADLNGGDGGYDVYTEENGAGGFDSVEFIVAAEYLGHESLDTFHISYEVPGSDGQDWVVEFNNGSGDWNSSMIFDMGLENSLNSSEFIVRVTPPNQTIAHSFETGHWINLMISTSDGYMYDHTVIVRIPRIYSFELSEPMNEIYGFEPGVSSNSISIHFTNTGNGDEKFRFEFDDSVLPENWSVPSNTTHTLGPFVSTTHSIPFTVPEGTDEASFTIYINVSSDIGNQIYPVIPVNIVTSTPSLSIISHQLASGGDPVSGTLIDYFVTVQNDGFVDAIGVWINGTVCSKSDCNNVENQIGVFGSDFGDIPANSEVTFDVVLDLDGVSTGTYYLMLNLESDSGIIDDYPVDQIKVRSPPIEETTDWIGWLLGALLVVALLLLTRGGGRRRSSAPF